MWDVACSNYFNYKKKQLTKSVNYTSPESLSVYTIQVFIYF